MRKNTNISHSPGRAEDAPRAVEQHPETTPDDDSDEFVLHRKSTVPAYAQVRTQRSNSFNVLDPESITVASPGRLSNLADDIFSKNRYLSSLDPAVGAPSHPADGASYSVASITPQDSDDDLALAHKWYLRTLIAINAIFVFLALVLVAAGSWALATEASNLAGTTLPAGIVVLGVFIMIVSFCGCAGAIKQSRVMLILYACMLVLLLICQLSVGISLYASQSSSITVITAGWTIANNDLRVTMQGLYSCCGLTSLNITAGQPCPTTAQSARPCLSLFVDSLNNSYSTVGGFALGFTALQVVCLLVGILLLRKVAELRAKRQGGHDIPSV